ncbi:MAG TPA: hypothetical protein VJ911_10570 [Cryomorphaceae bacterium]|nr:hypothetical protein [Cryomorphaceae bacterium]
MKTYTFLCIATLICTLAGAQNPDTSAYRVDINLKDIVSDQVHVEVYPPSGLDDTLVYNMPKIIPGTYSISNFGRFINNFKAFDEDSIELNFKRLDTNRWEIAGAQTLHFISYDVDDTFDEPNGAGIFEPGGTNIDSAKNVVFNPFGFVGYFDGKKHRKFKVNITKPENFYGETSLKRGESSPVRDIYYAKDYFELHDSPILYAEPDTASMLVADTRIAVAVYAPSKTISASDILGTIEDIFPAAADYLGGSLPVSQYSVLVYLTGGAGGSGGFGALEHNTSTVFVLPEAPLTALSQTFKDVTAHEFFHIVTPLNIHSEEIHDYDFMNPKMSAHLWLYEGCTEYAAQHVQVKEGLMDFDRFLNVMQGKMRAASNYDTGLAFTELSKKALKEHSSQYGNVYQKGALIGMAIDLKLRHLSDGDYGIQDLMQGLSEKYGVEKPFKDEELFDEIAAVSGFPEMKVFLEKHVANAMPLPFEELLEYAGVRYRESENDTVVSGGNIPIGYNPRSERLVVASTQQLDEFGKSLGFKQGDELLEWNGVELNLNNVQDVLNEFKQTLEEGDKVKVVVNRKLENGKKKRKKLKAKAMRVERERSNVLEILPNLTPRQKVIRKAWVNV